MASSASVNPVRSLVTKSPLLDQGDIDAKRQEILDYFHDSFSLYESIFECLANDEAFFARANPLRHPLIFYYGHTSVFFINKLNVANLIDQRVDPYLESTLAIGVDEMSWDDLNESSYDWPSPAEVKAHRDKTREIVDQFIRECDFTMPIDWNSPMWIVMMGIEHERIHLETTSMLIRELPLEMVKPHKIWSYICRETGMPPANELLPIAGGVVEMGKSRTNPLYGWDNEYGYCKADVAPFKASKFLVSNLEFLEFINDGGYQTESHWTEEGWRWVEYNNAEHPAQHGELAVHGCRLHVGEPPGAVLFNLVRTDVAQTAPAEVRLPVSDDARSHRNAMELACRYQLPGSQGLLQLEVCKNGQAFSNADGSRMVQAP